MRYRTLGQTGLRVSEIGFGTIPILKGDVPVLPDYYNLDDDEAIALLCQALECGINLFDTAVVPEYGDAEIKLGRFARQAGRERLIISDKARFFTGDEIYAAVCRSVENLGGIHPDVYFVHQADPEHDIFSPGGALDALVWCREEGKIGFTGVATHYYDLLERAVRDPRVDVVQGSGNLLERGMLDRMIQDTRFTRKGFLLNKVYAAGVLPGFFTENELLGNVLCYPISSALVGMGTAGQLAAALAGAARPAPKLTFEQVLSRLRTVYDPIPCDRCQRCVCPYGTEPHILLRQMNYFFLGKDYWALRKLDLDIARTAAQCRRCPDAACRKNCPRSLRIPEYIQEAERLVEQYIYHGWI
ncbi:MAG: aldo/keto reductase [Oscillospiraceae bacterium]|nr:aldo/keto reductase [Oscillospiraceae bacterium]